MTAPAPALCLENVTADYGHGPVIGDVSFSVAEGETVGMIGLNGAGKTTLIKVVLGLLHAQQGRVRMFGQSAEEREARGKIAYLPEKFEPPVFLTGMEFIRFSLSLYRRPFDAAAVVAAAARVSLPEEALRRRVNTYSKGMRQKTGLLATWLSGCPLMILDEPMSGLDPRARVQVKNEMLRCRDQGVTQFLSTHILADMDEICDRVLVIHGGAMPFIGTPSALREKTGEESLERAFLSIIDDSKKDL